MRLKMIYLTFTLLLLAACGQGFSGDYGDATIGVKYSFQNNGKVTVHILGTEQVLDFTREGKVLKVDQPNGMQVVFNILDDGSLQSEGFAGMHLKKVK